MFTHYVIKLSIKKVPFPFVKICSQALSPLDVDEAFTCETPYSFKKKNHHHCGQVHHNRIKQ